MRVPEKAPQFGGLLQGLLTSFCEVLLGILPEFFGLVPSMAMGQSETV